MSRSWTHCSICLKDYLRTSIKMEVLKWVDTRVCRAKTRGSGMVLVQPSHRDTEGIPCLALDYSARAAVSWEKEKTHYSPIPQRHACTHASMLARRLIWKKSPKYTFEYAKPKGEKPTVNCIISFHVPPRRGPLSRQKWKRTTIDCNTPPGHIEKLP